MTHKALQNIRILLIEDSVDNQRLIAHHLTKEGAEVLIAENGQVGCELQHDSTENGKPIDIILMDIEMPVLDGYDTTKLLRLQGVTTPIIAITAHEQIYDRRLCISAGCDDYLSKLVVPSMLVGTCAQWAASNAAERDAA